MDPNQLSDNNYPPAPMPNNEYPNNGYQNNTYPNNVNPNNGYQNNGYENNGYQNNGYQNNGYQNNGYQNNGYENNGYQNNGYQNNNYPNNVNPNNGYQPNVYQNNQQPVNNYPANAYPNPTNKIAHKSKYIWLITVIVVAIVAVGGYVILTNLKPNYNCSAPRSANIEEYVHCHPAEIEKVTSALANNGSPFNVTFDAKGDQLNINAKSKRHLSDWEISTLRNGIQSYGDSLSSMMSQSARDDVKEKVIAPVRVHLIFSNDDGTFITDKEFSYNN